jgi:hypothetical protein
MFYPKTIIFEVQYTKLKDGTDQPKSKLSINPNYTCSEFSGLLLQNLIFMLYEINKIAVAFHLTSWISPEQEQR